MRTVIQKEKPNQPVIIVHMGRKKTSKKPPNMAIISEPMPAIIGPKNPIIIGHAPSGNCAMRTRALAAASRPQLPG